MSLSKRAISVASIVGASVGALVVGGTTAHRLALAKYRGLAVDPDSAATDFDQLRTDREYGVSASDGVVLHVEEVGDRSAPLTVIFTHGWALRLGAWHFQRQALLPLADSGDIRAVYYDQRSHGRSTRSPADRATIAVLADDLASIIATAAPTGPVVLVGHSMGAIAILALAEAQPELIADRVSAVALISASAVDSRQGHRTQPSSAGPLRRWTQVNDGNPLVLFGTALATRYPRVLERGRGASRDVVWLLTRALGFADKKIPGPIVDYLDEMISATPLDVIADFTPALFRHDERGGIAALAGIPTLIAVGNEDRMTPPAGSQYLAQQLPDATLVIVEGAGHMVPLERPDDINAALLDLLHDSAKL